MSENIAGNNFPFSTVVIFIGKFSYDLNLDNITGSSSSVDREKSYGT
jgi:hypothetical protein